MPEPTVKPDVLVVGATTGSLGYAVVQELVAGDWEFGNVVTAGLGEENIDLNVLRSARIAEVLAEVRPDIVVCTVGVNVPVNITDAYLPSIMMDSFSANVIGPMDVLRHFNVSPVRNERAGHAKVFVAISSNSATIPRRRSVAYCASKAALSMALRVAAREMADSGLMVWGYEPGLLAGTPMTQEATAQLAPSDLPWAQMHRMLGVPAQGLPVQDLAQRIVHDIAAPSLAYNGVLFPFDAGEL